MHAEVRCSNMVNNALQCEAQEDRNLQRRLSQRAQCFMTVISFRTFTYDAPGDPCFTQMGAHRCLENVIGDVVEIMNDPQGF